MRNFNAGRQSELLYNEDLYKLYQLLENMLDKVNDPSIGPPAELEGALWLDRQSSSGAELKYFDAGLWKSVFDNKFQLLDQLLSPAKPTSAVAGQLWLNDGTLMYYNGIEWRPVKAAASNDVFNLDSFEQFLLINPLLASGSKVIDDIPGFDISTVHAWNTATSYIVGAYVQSLGNIFKCITNHTSGLSIDADISKWTQVTVKSQFLVPSVAMDRFFVNGNPVSDYEEVNSVTIQYPASKLTGKTASIVHVNPSKLVKVSKKLLVVDKTDVNNSIINYPESNTEFYGMSGGFGTLLVKAATGPSDYSSIVSGIKLSAAAATAYDFVMAITYNFERVKGEGYVSRAKTTLAGSNSIYIGTITEPKCVFVQGLLLDEDIANYTYDSASGYLNLVLDSKMDVSVFSFSYKEHGDVSSLDGNGQGVISLAKAGANKVHTYAHMIVFVNGLAITDYTYDVATHTVHVPNALVGMKYSVVDPGNLTFTSGTVQAGAYPYVPYDSSLFSEGVNPVLFINGIKITQNDLDIRDSEDKITAYGMKAGQDFILVRDNESRLIFDDAINFTTIPTAKHLDTAIVYIENHLICDANSATVAKLPDTGVEGEIKYLLTAGTQKWYQFKVSPTPTWVEITNPAKISDLDKTINGYSTSAQSISILQDYGPKECTYCAYAYANSVEEPLLYSNILTDGISTTFKVSFRHPYKTGTNSLQVWLNGVRQYRMTEIDSRTFELCYIDSNGVKTPIEAGQNIFYVVERPENGEMKSCESEILTIDNRIAGAMNMYSTTKPLYPGIVNVFISGIRQPKSAYAAVNANTLVVNGEIVGSCDNYPVETVRDGSKVYTVNHTVKDEIYIELRGDYSLKEFETTIGLDGKRIVILNQDMWDSVYNSKDLIMIYVNGLAYNGDYGFDDNGQSIILNDLEVTNKLRPNIDKVIIEWR